MISDFKQLEELFKEIDQNLKQSVNVYIIGGIVLLYQRMKPSTKDIDLIIVEKDKAIVFEKALKTINFKSKTPTSIYKHMDLGEILVRGEYRIDIFHKTVCKKFLLSDSIRKRAEKILALKNLNVYFCANEDIFVFKTFTERQGDLEDCISLAQRGIKWDIILQELQNQIKHSGQDVWITWIGERLDILEENGIVIPIMKEIDKLRDKYFEKLEKNYLAASQSKKSKNK